jgi:hypothetical protein
MLGRFTGFGTESFMAVAIVRPFDCDKKVWIETGRLVGTPEQTDLSGTVIGPDLVSSDAWRRFRDVRTPESSRFRARRQTSSV